MASTQHSWAITEQLGCAGFSLKGYMVAKILHNPSKSAAPLLWLTLPQVQAKTKTPTISGSSHNSSNSLKISIQPPINNHHQGSFLTILQQLDKSNQRPSNCPGLRTVHASATCGDPQRPHHLLPWTRHEIPRAWEMAVEVSAPHPLPGKTKVEGFRTCLC